MLGSGIPPKPGEKKHIKHELLHFSAGRTNKIPSPFEVGGGILLAPGAYRGTVLSREAEEERCEGWKMM